MPEPPTDGPSETPPDASPLDPRWLRNTRLAAAALLLLFALPALALWWPQDGLALVTTYTILFSPLFAALGLTLWRLRSGAHESGLSLAIATGSAVGWTAVAAGAVAVIIGSQAAATGLDPCVWRDREFLVFLTLFAIPCTLLFWVSSRLRRNATKAYDALWPGEKTRHPHLWRTVVIAALPFAGLCLCIFVVLALPTEKPRNEPSAVSALRTINTSLISYSSFYPSAPGAVAGQCGFPNTLAYLAPAPGGKATSAQADLLDGVLGVNNPAIKSGYSIIYTPANADANGCNTTYTATARPKEYGNTGRRSFFTDQTGVIRWTCKDRPATASDPPL